MNRAEQTGQRGYCSTNLVISQDDEKKKQRKRRNSSPFSYIEIIAYAILSSPQKRATLGLNGWSSLVENHIVIQRPCLQCCIHKSNQEPSWSNPSFSVTAPMEPLQYHYGSLTPSTAFHSLPTYIGLTGGTNVLPSVDL